MKQDSVQYTEQNSPDLGNYAVENQDSISRQQTLVSDSLAGLEQNTPVLVPSILKNHQLQPQKLLPDGYTPVREDWITIHFILALMVYAWVRLFYAKRLKQVFRSAIGIRFQGMMSREGNILRERISIALLIIYLIATSLLAYLLFTRILNYHLLQLSGFKLFSFLMLLVIFFWIFKNISNTIIGRVFKNPVIISEYLVTNFIFNIATGSLLLPILLLAVYLPSVQMVYAGLILWGIAFIYRLIRLLVTSLTFTKFSLFNRMLYLCTFEIAPVIVLTKLVMSNLE